uniref:Guanylate cyclase domain-containing protein n=1 Tax=Eutreptiella gymnastica TaxID=73025 RepID=A0A7S1I472_9EUGL
MSLLGRLLGYYTKLVALGHHSKDTKEVLRQKSVAVAIMLITTLVFCIMVVCWRYFATHTVPDDEVVFSRPSGILLFVYVVVTLICSTLALCWYFFMKSHVPIQYNALFLALHTVVISFLAKGCDVTVAFGDVFLTLPTGMLAFCLMGGSSKVALAWVGLSAVIVVGAYLLSMNAFRCPPFTNTLPYSPGYSMLLVLSSQGICQVATYWFISRIDRQARLLEHNACNAQELLGVLARFDVQEMTKLQERVMAHSLTQSSAQQDFLRILERLKHLRLFMQDSAFEEDTATRSPVSVRDLPLASICGAWQHKSSILDDIVGFDGLHHESSSNLDRPNNPCKLTTAVNQSDDACLPSPDLPPVLMPGHVPMNSTTHSVEVNCDAPVFNGTATSELKKRRATLLAIELDKIDQISIAAQLDIGEPLGAITDMIFTRVKKSKGTVTFFRGRQILASWNTVTRNVLHVTAAASCALDIQQGFKDLPVSAQLPELKIHMAIVSDVLVFGNVGTSVVSYNILGPAVDAALYLVSLNRRLGTRILIPSHNFREVEAEFIGRPVDVIEFPVPCAAQTHADKHTATIHSVNEDSSSMAIIVCELTGQKQENSATAEWMYVLSQQPGVCPRYAEAWKLFRNLEYSKASLLFRRLADEAPTDFVSVYLADICQSLEAVGGQYVSVFQAGWCVRNFLDDPVLQA